MLADMYMYILIAFNNETKSDMELRIFSFINDNNFITFPVCYIYTL